ncbi:hypothetical protein ACFCX4_05000, partial [Kitasatospora sp. NPDC056327]
MTPRSIPARPVRPGAGAPARADGPARPVRSPAPAPRTGHNGGRPYVPLDDSYPADRLRMVVEGAECRLAVADP